MGKQAYHGDEPLPLKELQALRVLASRLRAEAEQATERGFDVVASAELDRLLTIESHLRAMIEKRKREEVSAA